MGVKHQLVVFKRDCDRFLESFFDSRIEEITNSHSKEALSILKEFTLRGGKRFRAALFFEGYKCFSDKNLNEVMKTSICMELIQSYLLIHDDIIDKDDTRRGGPTVHVQYDSKHLGMSMAIIIGDISASLANQILTKSKLSDKRKVAALSRLNQCVHKVLHGEMLDVLQNVISEEDALEICTLKTSSYTFEGPLIIGATLAGASNSDISVLSNYAVPLGQAFQLNDDILDLFEDSKKSGKPCGSDIREGKKTLLILKALESASPTEKKFIHKCLGNQNLKNSDVNKLRNIIKSTGALSYVEDKCKECASKAKEALNDASFNTSFLIDLADYISKKSY